MMTIRLAAHDGYYCLRVDGHAGYAAGGQDIVCAAVSVLVCTLHQCLIDANEQTYLTHYDARLNSGEAMLCWRSAPAFSERVECVWDTILTGLRLVAGHYPAYVDMIEQDDTLIGE